MSNVLKEQLTAILNNLDDCDNASYNHTSFSSCAFGMAIIDGIIKRDNSQTPIPYNVRFNDVFYAMTIEPILFRFMFLTPPRNRQSLANKHFLAFDPKVDALDDLTAVKQRIKAVIRDII